MCCLQTTPSSSASLLPAATQAGAIMLPTKCAPLPARRAPCLHCGPFHGLYASLHELSNADAYSKQHLGLSDVQLRRASWPAAAQTSIREALHR